MTQRKAPGTSPPGTSGEQEAARWVRGMFGRVAKRYDLLNHLLSFNLDRRWRARTIQRVQEVVADPGARILDLCCGTGDLLLALEARHGGPVLGGDFCHPMLQAARRKMERQHSQSSLLEADALRLPFRDASFDLITIAFGLRNLADYRLGLQEMLRLLRPSGVAAILEFSTPPNALFSQLYDFYSRRVIPTVGGAISGSGEAYVYLPDSVRKFPGAEELAQQMRSVGFQQAEFERMTGGIVTLHLGKS